LPINNCYKRPHKLADAQDLSARVKVELVHSQPKETDE
jgi:hypothetical protein